MFLRDGGIDGAKHLFAIDVEEFVHRFWIWRCREGLDHLGHPRVRWRRHDLSSRAADRAQAKFGIVAGPLVEGFNRMGTEGCWHRRVLSELRPDCRIVSD